MVGGIMIILGAALGFTNYLVDAFIPMKILKLMEGMVGTKIMFLLVLNFYLNPGRLYDGYIQCYFGGGSPDRSACLPIRN